MLRKWKKQETGNPRIYDTRTVPFSSRENSLKQVHHFTMRLSYHHHHHQKEEKRREREVVGFKIFYGFVLSQEVKREGNKKMKESQRERERDRENEEKSVLKQK